MLTEDLKALSQIGQALWAEPERSERAALETLAAVSTLMLEPDRMAERTGLALLQRAMKEGNAVSGSSIQNPFFRLSPEERLVLSALHLGRWSYERIGRVLGKSPDEVAQAAWSARLELICAPGVGIPLAHPAGSGSRQIDCPEFNPSRPWTQSFLDEEMNGRQRIFLQNHLVACNGCRQALVRARAVYFAAQSMVPRATQEEKRVREFTRAIRITRAVKDPLQMSFLESILGFLGRAEVWLMISGFVIFLIWLARVSKSSPGA